MTEQQAPPWEDIDPEARVIRAELRYRNWLATLPIAFVMGLAPVVPFYVANGGTVHPMTEKILGAIFALAFISAAWYLLHLHRYRRREREE